MTYRAVVTLDLVGISELSQNVLGQDLSELDTHLVVRVDPPDSSLDVDLVLCERKSSRFSLTVPRTQITTHRHLP